MLLHTQIEFSNQKTQFYQSKQLGRFLLLFLNGQVFKNKKYHIFNPERCVGDEVCVCV